MVKRSKSVFLTCIFDVFKIWLWKSDNGRWYDVKRSDVKICCELVQMYDDVYPEEFFEEYCEYYKMSMEDFKKNIDKWANKDLFEKK